MIVSRIVQRFSGLAALVAVALLCLATVRSTVMQAEADALGGVPLCSAPIGKASGHADKARKTCAVCAAVAHAPVTCHGAVLPAPIAVAWAPHRIQTATGPRGPPAFRASARGPPLPLSTV